jgi:hypothetical protein
MRLAALSTSILVLLSGCGAAVGDTNVNLHQMVEFVDGTSLTLREFQMSTEDSDRPRGQRKLPGNEVTVWVELRNAGRAIKASETELQFFYTDERGEVQPPQSATTSNVVQPGNVDRIGKTFRVEDASALFRTRHLRVLVELPNYPSVTFAGSVP